jgi:benzoate/toluate 1,2-dioxygenase alpha subunit
VLQYADFYGASGVGTPDDLAEFNACQLGYEGRLARTHVLERGATRVVPGADEEARRFGLSPVASIPAMNDETIFHGLHREWRRLMGGSDE